MTYHCFIYRVSCFIREYTSRKTRHNLLHFILMAAAQDIVVNSHVDPLETKHFLLSITHRVTFAISKAQVFSLLYKYTVLLKYKTRNLKGTLGTQQVLIRFSLLLASYICFLVTRLFHCSESTAYSHLDGRPN